MDDRLMMSSSDEQDDVAPMTGSERISIDDCFFKTPPSSPDRVSRSLSLYSPIKNSLHLSPVLASIHLKDADRSMQGTVSDAYDDVPAHRLFAFNASDSGNTSCDMDDFAFGSPSDDVMPEDVSDLDDDDDMFEFGFSTKSSQLGQPASSANTNEGLQHQTHSAEDQEMSEEQMDLDIDDFLSNCDINAVEANADGNAIILALQRACIGLALQLASSVLPPTAAADKDDDSAGDESQSQSRNFATRKAGSKRRKKLTTPSYEPVVLRLTTSMSALANMTNDDGEEPEKPVKHTTRRFALPHARGSCARRMAILLKIIEEIIFAIRTGRYVTLRDIYYRDTELFKSQVTVNTIVNHLAQALNISRARLMIVAAAKGLVIGPLRLINRDGSATECSAGQGQLIPAAEMTLALEVGPDVRFVLVVEKEAVFSTLVGCGFHRDQVLGSSLVITGKGYPDVATRQLMRRLSESLPKNVPLLCLVDGDPHGLEIYKTYACGSATMEHANDDLIIPTLQLIGVCTEDLSHPAIDADQLSDLTAGDFRKAYSLMARETLPVEIRREAAAIIHLGKKAEIQALSSVDPDGLVNFLRFKIQRILDGWCCSSTPRKTFGDVQRGYFRDGMGDMGAWGN